MQPSSPLPIIREAYEADADEVLRLAYLMWDEIGLETTNQPWEHQYRAVFSRACTSTQGRILVAQHPNDTERVVACGTAWVHQLLPAPWLPTGNLGYLQWFFTEPAWRGQHLARTIAQDLIAWLRNRGCPRVHLHAALKAKPLYDGLGFETTRYENLWLDQTTSDQGA